MKDLREYNRQYYLKNKEKCLRKNRISATKWRKENPEKARKYKRTYDQQLRKDPSHRLSNNMRGNMHHALKAKKAGRKWEDLAGYTLQDLINHFTSLLKEGMTWENYGEVWHIDHIKPKSWFKYISPNDAEFTECWALSNLQPKFKTDNLHKGNRFCG